MDDGHDAPSTPPRARRSLLPPAPASGSASAAAAAEDTPDAKARPGEAPWAPTKSDPRASVESAVESGDPRDLADAAAACGRLSASDAMQCFTRAGVDTATAAALLARHTGHLRQDLLRASSGPTMPDLVGKALMF